MAQKIFKFPLEVTDEQVIEIQNGAKILTIQTQITSGKESEVPVKVERPCIWAMVNEE